MRILDAPLWVWLVVGVFATLVMDIGGGVLRATGVTAGTPPQFIAKWILGLFQGRFVVEDIRTSAGPPGSIGLFMPFHYLIGLSLTGLYAAILHVTGSPFPPWWVSVLFGLATTVLPAFWMFPSMGFGWLGLRGPPEFHLLRTAILNHAFFGIGLAIAVRWIIPRFR